MIRRKTADVKQKFFMARELRLSVALIVIWSLLAGMIFTYLAKELKARIEFGIFSYVIIFLGYVFIVIMLSLFFTHRFIGPFERLKMEMKIIMAGNYHRRLRIRTSDDVYVKSFISDVNKMLEELEKGHLDKEGFRKKINSELLHIMSLAEKEDIPKDQLRTALLSFHKKVEALLKKKE